MRYWTCWKTFSVGAEPAALIAENRRLGTGTEFLFWASCQMWCGSRSLFVLPSDGKTPPPMPERNKETINYKPATNLKNLEKPHSLYLTDNVPKSKLSKSLQRGQNNCFISSSANTNSFILFYITWTHLTSESDRKITHGTKDKIKKILQKGDCLY